MRRRKSRQFSLVIAFVILVSWMCLGDARAEASFAYTPTESSQSDQLSVETAVVPSELCTGEMLGAQRTTGVQPLFGQYVNQKKEMSSSCDLQGLSADPLEHQEFYLRSEGAQLHKTYQDELVSFYIHKSDGKKRTA